MTAAGGFQQSWNSSGPRCSFASCAVTCLTFHLTVENNMHVLLWADSPASDLEVKKRHDTRVPTFRPLILTWRLPLFRPNIFSSSALENLQQLQQPTVRNNSDLAIGEVAWPVSLQRLTFGCRFSQEIDGVVWPASLQQVILGRDFKSAVERPGLFKKLTFGRGFNQAVDGIA